MMTNLASDKIGEKSGGDEEQAKKKDDDGRVKVVIRHLPPALTEPELRELVKGHGEKFVLLRFCRANQELQPFVFTRAYMAFASDNDAYAFCKEFNGKVLTDSKGNQSLAVVERAPNQVIPDYEKGRNDKRLGTLKDEFAFKKFEEEYQAANNNTQKVIDFEALVREIQERKKRLAEGTIHETPLIEYIVEQNVLSKKKKRKSEEKEVPKGKSTANKYIIDDSINQGKSNREKERSSDKPPRNRETRRERRERRGLPPAKEKSVKEEKSTSSMAQWTSSKETNKSEKKKVELPERTVTASKPKESIKTGKEINNNLSAVENDKVVKKSENREKSPRVGDSSFLRKKNEGEVAPPTKEKTPESYSSAANRASEKAVIVEKSPRMIEKKPERPPREQHQDRKKTGAEVENSASSSRKPTRNKDRPEREIYKPRQRPNREPTKSKSPDEGGNPAAKKTSVSAPEENSSKKCKE